MNIYLISQDEIRGPGTYDSAVVVAEDEATARHMHPGTGHAIDFNNEYSRLWWCNSPNDVTVLCIATANYDVEPGIVLASFNARY